MDFFAIYKELSLKKSEEFQLVLQSCGIYSRIIKSGEKWTLMVHEYDKDIARDEIDKYISENHANLHVLKKPDTSPDISYSAIFIICILVIAHWKVSQNLNHESVIDSYASSAKAILNGDLYRCITSLFLHSDIVHLSGNIVFLAIFGTVVCLETGSGAGWLIILLAGFSGNLMNAYFYKTSHIAIGASTAVFGATGVLTGSALINRFRWNEHALKILAPVGAGLALLAMLGAGGGNTDIMGHFFGFVSGVISGALFTLLIRKPPSDFYQNICHFGSAVLVSVSWIWGIFA